MSDAQAMAAMGPDGRATPNRAIKLVHRIRAAQRNEGRAGARL